MKIPGIEVGPVPEIANQPVGAYYAKGAALAQLGETASRAITEANNIYGEAQYTKNKAAAVGNLTSLKERLLTQAATPVEDIPDGIKYDPVVPTVSANGTTSKEDRPSVLTHLIAPQWWDKQARDIIEQGADQMWTPGLKRKFRDEMYLQYFAPAQGEMIKHFYDKQKEYGGAVAEVAIKEFIEHGDQKSAQEVLDKGSKNGTIDPTKIPQFQEYINDQGTMRTFLGRVYQAQDIASTDQLERELGTLPIGVEKMSALAMQLSKQRADINATLAEKHDTNYEGLVAMAIGGQLTTPQIQLALVHNEINGGQGDTLHNIIKVRQSESNTQHDKKVLGSLQRDALQVFQGTSTDDTIDDKVKNITNQVLTNTNLPDEVILPFINNLTQMSKMYKESGKYKQALTLVKGWTRVMEGTEGIVAQTLAPEAPTRAYFSFKQALDDYVNTAGPNADPVQFYNLNREHYIPGTKGDKNARASWLEGINTQAQSDPPVGFALQQYRKIHGPDSIPPVGYVHQSLTGAIKAGNITPDQADAMLTRYSSIAKGLIDLTPDQQMEIERSQEAQRDLKILKE